MPRRCQILPAPGRAAARTSTIVIDDLQRDSLICCGEEPRTALGVRENTARFAKRSGESTARRSMCRRRSSCMTIDVGKHRRGETIPLTQANARRGLHPSRSTIFSKQSVDLLRRRISNRAGVRSRTPQAIACRFAKLGRVNGSALDVSSTIVLHDHRRRPPARSSERPARTSSIALDDLQQAIR